MDYVSNNMKNGLIDLNNHLFAQIERLSDGELSADQLNREIDRTKAICHVSTQIINNANTVTRGLVAAKEYNIKPEQMPVITKQAPSALPGK